MIVAVAIYIGITTCSLSNAYVAVVGFVPIFVGFAPTLPLICKWLKDRWLGYIFQNMWFCLLKP